VKANNRKELKMARGRSQGISSKNNREVGVRTGAGAKKIREGGAAQVGIIYGTHVTTGRAGKRYEGERLYGGDGFNKVKYGNEVALNVGGGGPGKGYVQYGQAGSQCQYGKANPGNPTPVKKTQIELFGPDSAIVKTRR
jgi:hypothetical protein